MARKSLNREHHKSRDCLITIFKRNSTNGAQPISLKLLKGLGWSHLSARSSASKCIAFCGRHWRPAPQQVFARVGTAVHCLLTPFMGLASKLDFAKIAEGTYQIRPRGLHPRGRADKSGTGMTEIMPVPRNLILLSYQQGASGQLFTIAPIPEYLQLPGSYRPSAPAVFHIPTAS